MNLIAWVLSLSILILLVAEAVDFHRATLCRQEAWLKSTELTTRTVLFKSPDRERSFHLSCKMSFLREGKKVTWKRISSLKSRHFLLELDGRL